MKATAGSATRSEAATSAAAPALARWKCTEERAGVDVDGGAAPARAGGDGPSLRAPRMAMAVSFSFRAACFCFRLGYIRGCVYPSYLFCGAAWDWPVSRIHDAFFHSLFPSVLLDRKAGSKSPHFSLNPNKSKNQF